jgi:hypothetical protein
MAEEILKDHKSWGNKVRIYCDKFYVEIKSKDGDKEKSNKVADKVGDDLPAGQPMVTLGFTAAYVE